MGNLMYGFPRFGVVFVVAAVLLFTSGCDNQPDATVGVYWQPPLIPIKFGIDTHGNISANVSSRIVTFMGTFELGATAGVGTGPPPIKEKNLRLRFRDYAREVDIIYDVAVGDVPYEIYTKGETRLTVSNSEVIIDVSEASCVQIIKAGNIEELGCDASRSELNIYEEGIVQNGISIGSTVRVTSVELNIRTAPGTDASIITKIKKGTWLEVVDGPASVPSTLDDGRHIQRIWWKVRGWDNKGRLGWAAGHYLEPVP